MPTVADYNRVLRACAQDGQYQPGCWLIEEMVELGLEPDRTSFVHAIQSCAKPGRYEEANHLLNCMKDANHDLDHEVYESIIMACENAGNWRQVSEKNSDGTPRYVFVDQITCLVPFQLTS